ncbi:uncharacterized protein LOC124798883 [Schistocerca piceifrons]|uniref:uncharacterized protein LOC124798883 n=1 Tax=Schistocerca piceifrons TaxID=274613 RepID=UPI001F5EFA80|nr:uncharacterized protein LOC124798883 [Schistocerca piceifrons]
MFPEKLKTAKNTQFHGKNTQHGFQKSKSTVNASFAFLNEALNAIDSKEHISAIFLDLSNASDVISHNILLKELESVGTRGPAHEWLKSYLQNREQVAVLPMQEGNKIKYYCSEKHSVLQDSILGPILFLLFVNDLDPTSPHHNYIKFADDTIVMIKERTREELLHEIKKCTTHITDGFSVNNLVINTEKTVTMHLHIVENKYPLIRDIELFSRAFENVSSTKLHGILIQEDQR